MHGVMTAGASSWKVTWYAVADNYGRPYKKDDKSKPNNRIVYTIFAGNSYIDLNVIKEL